MLYPGGCGKVLGNVKQGCSTVRFVFSGNHSEPRVENRLERSTAAGWGKDYEFAEIFLGEMVAARTREAVRTKRSRWIPETFQRKNQWDWVIDYICHGRCQRDVSKMTSRYQAQETG